MELFRAVPLFVWHAIIALIIAALALVVHREAQRVRGFDRRLAVPRSRALAVTPRAGREGRGGGGAPGLALLKSLSILAPMGAQEREKLATLIRGAGFEHPDAVSIFLSVKLGAGAVFGAGAGFFAASSDLLGAYTLLVVFAAVAGFVVGGVVPEYVLRAVAARRVRRMEAALADALDLLVMCLTSGLTFERALLTVAEELAIIAPSLAAEFRLVEAELRLGANRRDVLQSFHDRTPAEGLKSLATTLIQSERYGTPLTESLQNIAAEERLQRAARLTTQAERLPVLLTLPMLLLVVPGTIVLVAGPAVLIALRGLSSLGGG